MKRALISLAVTILAFAIAPVVEAQSPEMPEPSAILVDADGKPMVQVMFIDTSSIHVLFDFEGESATFANYDDHSDFENHGRFVYFSLDNCKGDVFLTNSLSGPLERLHQRAFVIAGPDATEGTYRVFRSTSTSAITTYPESALYGGGPGLTICADELGSQRLLLPAEEILPNPLAGFHGPTIANPDRRLTVRGGTRLP